MSASAKPSERPAGSGPQAQAPPKRRRRRRWVWRAAIALVVLILLLPLLAIGLLQTQFGRDMALDIARDALSASGIELEVSGLGGFLPFQLTADRVQISDSQGVAIVAEDVSLAVEIGPLFAGAVDVSELFVGRADIFRPLETGGAETPVEEAVSEAIPWPLIPIDVAAPSLEIKELHLGPDIMGEPLILAVSGAFNATSAEADAKLAVDRLDQPGGHVRVDAVIGDAFNDVSLDVEVFDPSGGLLSEMLGEPDLPGLTIDVDGQGSQQAWQGTVDARIGGESVFGGSYAITQTDESVAAEWSFAADPVALEFVPQADIIGRLTTSGRVAFSDTLVSIEELSVESAAVQVSAAGTLRPDDETASVDATIQVPQALGLQALTEVPIHGALQADVRLTGGSASPTIQLQLTGRDVEVEGFAADGLTLNVSAENMDFAAPKLAVDVELATDGLVLPFEMPEGLATGAVQFSARTSYDSEYSSLDLSEMTLLVAPVRLAGDVSVDLENLSVGGDVTLDAEDAAPLLQMAGFEGAAALASSIGFATEIEQEFVWVDADISLSQVALADPTVGPLLGDSANLAATGLIGFGGTAEGLSVSLETPVLSLEASGGVNPEQDFVDLAVQVRTTGAEGVAESLIGPDTQLGQLVADIAASGALTAPVVRVSATARDMEISGIGFSSAAVDLTGAPQAGGAVTGNLAVAIESPFGDGTVSADVVADLVSMDIRIANLAVDALGVRANGAADLALDEERYGADLTIAANDIAPVAQLAGLQARGGITAALNGVYAGGDASVDLDADLRSLSLDSGGSVISVAAADVAVQAEQVIAAPSGTLRVGASGIATDGVAIDTLTLTGSGGGGGWQYTVATAGEVGDADVAVASTGTIDIGGGPSLSVASLSAQYADFELVTGQTFQVSFANGIALNDFAGEVAGMPLAADLTVAPGAVEASVRVGPGEVTPLTEAIGGPVLTGSVVELSVDLNGPSSAPSGVIRLDAEELAFRDTLRLGPRLTVDAVANVTDGLMSLDATLSGIGDPPMEIEIGPVFTLSLDPFVFEPREGQPLNGRIDGPLALAEFSSLISPTGYLLLSGTAVADMQLGGTVGNPAIQGGLELENGGIEDVQNGIYVRDIDVVMRGNASQIVIERLSATDGRGGRLTGAGSFQFTSPEATVDADVTLDEFTVVGSDLATAVVSGSIDAVGPMSALALTGDLVASPVEINLPEQLPASVVELDVIEVNGGPAEREVDLGQAPSSVAPEILLDVSVSMPRQVFVRGLGLDSEWQGQLEIGGSTLDPRIAGTVSVLRGSLEVAGNPLNLERGVITFTGANPPDPQIDIAATINAEDAVVTIAVSGVASDPSIDLSSDPALPEEEIVSRLLFSSGFGALSAAEALRSGEAMDLLGGGGGGLGIVSMARELTGIQGLRVDVEGGITDTSQIEVSGYATEDVYVTLSPDSAEVDYQVLDWLDLTTSVDEEGQSSVGIAVEWDY